MFRFQLEWQKEEQQRLIKHRQSKGFLKQLADIVKKNSAENANLIRVEDPLTRTDLVDFLDGILLDELLDKDINDAYQKIFYPNLINFCALDEDHPYVAAIQSKNILALNKLIALFEPTTRLVTLWKLLYVCESEATLLTIGNAISQRITRDALPDKNASKDKIEKLKQRETEWKVRLRQEMNKIRGKNPLDHTTYCSVHPKTGQIKLR